MATKSITNEVVLSSKKQAKNFINAIEKASEKKHKPLKLSKEFNEIKNEDIGEFAKLFK